MCIFYILILISLDQTMTCTRLTYGELVKYKPLHITLHIQAYKCQNIDYTHTWGFHVL